MYGMSFKEYLELKLEIEFPKLKLDEILSLHETFAFDTVMKLEELDKKILPLFKQYLKTGYYP